MSDFDDLAKTFEKMATALADKELAPMVKKAALPVRDAARAAAPKKTGLLASGIILHKEKSRHKGKAAYDVYMDPKKNEVFQKPIKNRVQCARKYAYYPASQEYGFFTRRADGGMTYTRADGSAQGIDKVPGKHFLRTGAEVAGEAAKEALGNQMLEAIDRAWGG